MHNVLRAWYYKYFSDTEATILFIILTLGVLSIVVMGQMMAPVLASLVIAYLLEWVITALENKNVPRLLAVFVVYFAFIGVVLIAMFGLMPVLWQQFKNLFDEMPNMVNRLQHLLYLMPEKFPDFITKSQVDSVIVNMNMEFQTWGKAALGASLSSIPALISIVIYFVLVPVLIFFMLKDKKDLISSFGDLMPHQKNLLVKVWEEVDDQIGNYVRGKIVEISIIGGASFILFYVCGLKYGLLLAALVGLSVLVPYVGAAVVTIPVVLVAYFQFGVNPIFWYVTIGYFIIQILDGNVLVPLLFSEAVNLHPVMIIVAILFFGGIWGFWGVFFAIPLATLVKAVMTAWPSSTRYSLESAQQVDIT